MDDKEKVTHLVHPLSIAIKRGACGSILMLLGSDDRFIIHLKEPDGYTPLHLAAGCGNVNLVRLLLRLGANPNSVCNEGYTPFMVAVYHNYQQICKVLLKFGAYICTDTIRFSLIHCRSRFVYFLVEHL